jgi:hypothetical protein
VDFAADARDNGARGLRSHDHPDCHAAFVLDPNSHTVDAVRRDHKD